MRPLWDDVWMEVADAISQRSRCIRQYGAVIVTAENRIVATGYNGPPAAFKVDGPDCVGTCPHASKEPGESVGYADCISIHAEANSLLFCDRRDREGGTIYITGIPCFDCGKLIANSGLRRAVFRNDVAYRDLNGVLNLFLASKVEPKILVA